MGISAVINTRNEERTIVRCLKSIVPYVDEIVVVDMRSSDKTRSLARQYTKKIYIHDPIEYVEPARNFAISKATGDWILVLDSDETLPESLGIKLRRLTATTDISYYRIPFKNILFGTWMEHTGWWPDYHVRFFKKGLVSWREEIHSIPITEGKGADLTATQENAIVHYNYSSVSEFIEQVNRYGNQTAREKINEGKTFTWQSLVSQPTQEFLRRFFMWEGYKDGIHGLALSLLQAAAILAVELKIWEMGGFVSEAPDNFLPTWWKEVQKTIKETRYWYYTKIGEQTRGFEKVVNKIRLKTRL